MQKTEIVVFGPGREYGRAAGRLRNFQKPVVPRVAVLPFLQLPHKSKVRGNFSKTTVSFAKLSTYRSLKSQLWVKLLNLP